MIAELWNITKSMIEYSNIRHYSSNIKCEDMAFDKKVQFELG
jgi:hypothetical protein